MSSTMAKPSSVNEYDPEIRDIADYVANKPIDSELAVRPLIFGAPATPRLR
jgi:2-methylcitrate dehydratase